MRPNNTAADPSPAVQAAGQALNELGTNRAELASALARLVTVVAEEAHRSARFASALTTALVAADLTDAVPKRTGRRSPGAFDPFAVYGETGESGLRDRLATLDLEQLRDIVAEHGMDYDRLAMKWKDRSRVTNRIVDKVSARATKGSAFRAVRD